MVDDRHMYRALELAQRHLHTHPNPRVGAVVVDRNGDVVGEGFHQGPGTAHAEVAALQQAGERSQGSTVFVTLEPCSHQGRTPPCVDALIDAGVARVVIGVVDPDPRVSGSGLQRLRAAGIEPVIDFPADTARAVDPAYFHHRESGLPLVTLKWAMTLDGSVAAQDGTSQWITSEEARAHAHETRAMVDAVVVGAGTLREDDPSLDVRLEGYSGPQPRPVIIAGREPMPEARRIWEREPVVISTMDRAIPSGDVVRVSGPDLPDPVESAKALADLGLLHVLMEGGPTLAGAWWRAGLIDGGVVYIGSKLGGGAGRGPFEGTFATISDAAEVEFTDVGSVGSDVLIEFKKKR